MRWLILLCLLPAVSAVSLGEVQMEALPEDWQDQPSNLGLRLDVRFDLSEAPAGATSATVTDGTTTVQGQGVSRARFFFDVDGSVDGQSAAALQGTEWSVELVIDDEGLVHRSRHALTIAPILDQGLWKDGPVDTHRLPAGVLPFDMGTPVINAADATSWRVLAPETPLQWRVYEGNFLANQVQWTLQDQFSAPAQGMASIDLPTNGFFAISVSGGTGAAWHLIGDHVPLTNLTPPAPGASGFIQVQGQGEPSLPGVLYATNLAGPRILGQGVLGPGPQLEGGLDGRSVRSEQVSGYRIFGMMLAPDYVGHVAHVTGLSASLQVPLLGDGEDAEIAYQLHGTGERAPVLVTLRADGQLVGERTVWLGTNASGAFPFTPDGAGALTLSLQLDRGDILHSLQETVTVLDVASYEDAQKSWYHPDRLLPSPLLAPVLGLVGALLHKRQIRRSSGPECASHEA